MTDTIPTTKNENDVPAERHTGRDGKLWLRVWQPSGIPGMLQLQWVCEAFVSPEDWARFTAE